ncbi:MAG: pilus assembly protein PilE [Gammaproteobacteria bacterium]|nr:MAG: pilus assembly protein PilE [Gammaproteobacteria bacterium]
MKKRNRGFTLVELMVVIAIVGILASVAYPSYIDSVKKAQRADAIDALLVESGRMEEFYMNSDTYTGATVANATSSEGFYNMSVVIPVSGLTYTITAAPVTTDTLCGNLTLDSLGQKGVSVGTVAACW